MNIERKPIIHSKTEKEYRLSDRLNYSNIKLFAEDRKAFYHQVVLKEPKKEQDSYALVLGSLIDCLCFEGDFDEKFVLHSAPMPKGQMLDFANNLYSCTLKSMDEGGKCSESMANLLECAYNMTAFDSSGAPIAFKGKSLEKVIQMFEGTDAEIYYKQLRASTGKYVVSVDTINIAEKVVNELKTNPNTAEIVNRRTGGDWEVLHQFPIDFTLFNTECKILLDKLDIDHNNKIIYPYDLKSTFDVENFDYNYIKYKYYIQQSLYRQGVIEWAKSNNLDDYFVAPMQFIVCDTSLFNQSLIYQCSEDDYVYGIFGFVLNNRYYKGINNLITEIEWHNNTGVWNISQEEYKNNGIKSLNLPYNN